MFTPDRDRVAVLVDRMAAGDIAAVVPFIAEFGDALARVVRRQLGSYGRHDVLADRAQIDELVQEAALVIFDRAGAWSRDGGAAPWTWAERAIHQRVIEHLGHPSVEFDPVHHEPALHPDRAGGPAPVSAAAGDVDFDDLAARIPEIGLLNEAIDAVGSARDRQVHIQYRVQKVLGDPSPAHTVAGEFGLEPDNVRQIDRRMRVKVHQLIEDDPRYAGLADLGWWAA